MNYKLINAKEENKEELIQYKLASILDYADDLIDKEKSQIINYVNENVPRQIESYKMITVDNKIIGCLLITNHEDGVLLDEIYIDNEYQNKGIGTNIIKELMKNKSKIYLWVYKNNTKAVNLYQKLGFNIIEETDSRYYMKYEDMFEHLKLQIQNCKFCEERFGFTPHPVFWGKKNSKIVQISQAPSNNVHNSGKPFTDMSGKTLRNEWYQISESDFYNTDNFFIGAIAHCYPGKSKNGGDLEPPKCCFDKWVKHELEILDNEIYIIVGAKAAKRFFPNENFEELVFKDNTWNGKLTIVLPHPSPLNRRWVSSHPEFMDERIIEVRKIIYKIINRKK